MNELIEEQERLKEWNKYVEAYKKFHKYNDVDSMTDEELEILDRYDGIDSDEVPRRKKESTYIIIFDDMISTNAFGTKRKSKLNNLIILCRHYNINIFITAQHIKSVPAIIRSNCRVLVIFKSNIYKKLLENVYSEILGIIKQEKFEELYAFSTAKTHNALVVINHNDLDEKYKIRLNWDTTLEYQ